MFGKPKPYNYIKSNQLDKLEAYINKRPHELEQVAVIESQYTRPVVYAYRVSNYEAVDLLLKLSSEHDYGKRSSIGQLLNFICSYKRHNKDPKDIEYIKRILLRDDIKQDKINKSLLQACQRGNAEFVQLLVKDKRVNLNTCHEGNQGTALHYAARQNNIEIFKILIEAGIDHTLLSNENRNAISYATDQELIDYYNQDVLKKIPSKQLNEFVLENDSCVSVTKHLKESDILIRTVYDFDDQTVTTLTQQTGAPLPPLVQHFSDAANKDRLKAAKAFLSEQRQPTTNIQTNVIS